MGKKNIIILGLILTLCFPGAIWAQKAKKAYEPIQWNKPQPKIKYGVLFTQPAEKWT